jgi:uncharacterized protein with FMN-binding domain
MRRIVTWALSTITTLVLLMSYHTSTSSTASTVNASGVTPGSASKGGRLPAPFRTPVGQRAPATARRAGSSNGSASSADGTTFAGAAVPTRFGNVQVQITVVDKQITAATVLQIPNRDRKDIQINNRAVPILNSATVKAQSADIDMVSGATVTSVAYIQSLQSAIDKANL